MVEINKLRSKSKLDDPIDRILNEMEQYSPEDPEYQALLTNLERLVKVKAEERRAPVSLDTIVMVVGNLAGILAIVAYERSHVVTSKAMTLIGKPRQLS